MNDWLKELNEVLETLKKSTPAHVLRKIKEGRARFAVLTPDNPFDKTKQMTHEQIRSELNEMQRKGLISGFFAAKGVYNAPHVLENSYVVENPKDFSHVLNLGKRAGQEAVLLSHKGHNQMAYVNGQNAGMANEGHGHAISDKFTQFSTRINPRSHKKPSYVQSETNYGGEQVPISLDKSQEIDYSQKTLAPNLDHSQLVPLMPMKEEHSNLKRIRGAFNASKRQNPGAISQ